MGRGHKWDRVRNLSQKYATPEKEVRKMLNSGMSDAAVARTLQARWRREELNIDRLGVLLKHYAPVSVYGDKEKSKQIIGHILNARRTGEIDELAEVMLAKLSKAKRIEAAFTDCSLLRIHECVLGFCGRRAFCDLLHYLDLSSALFLSEEP